MFVQSRREGFALAGAVLAMLVVGAIVTGGFYAANHQSAAVRSQYLGDLSQYIAETGLDYTVANTPATLLDTLTINTQRTLYNAQSVQYGGRTVGTYTSTITKVTATLFVIQSTGTVTLGGANGTHTVATVVKLRTASMDNNSAMQVYGDLNVGGTADVNGGDSHLSAWSGCTDKASGTAAVTAQPGASVTSVGAGDIDGAITRQRMDSTNFTIFGDLTWSDLTAMATKVYPSGASPNPAPDVQGGVCVTSTQDNWGAPKSNTNACFSYFPIIWARGNMSINANSSGQGILLVEGNLDIMGQFEFYGPVVVRGTIFLRGGSQIYGNIYAFGGGVLGADNTLRGNMVVQYSSCSIKRAVLGVTGLSRGVPIKDRAWFDLSSIQNSY